MTSNHFYIDSDGHPTWRSSCDRVPWRGGLRIGVGVRVVINESW